MSYGSLRDVEQLRMMEHSIDDFIDRYNNSSGPVAGPRQTVFLFPGGLASRLKRANAPYVDGMPDSQAFAYDTVWIDPIGIFFGDAKLLKQKKVGGKRRDKGNRIIIADGALNVLGLSPYSGFELACRAARLDYFTFGWDWRRSVNDVGKFFVHKFLPHFQDRVKNGCNNADALAMYSLVGHSAGGMLANWILRKHDSAQLRRVVTVATPFYGYGGQTHRWFEGEPLLNPIVGKDEMIRVITSMPGNYAYQFLPEAVFNDNKAALANDGTLNEFPLAGYPSLDKDTLAIADAYDPKTNGALRRYPPQSTSGFDKDELKKAKRLVKLLASPLDASQMQKLYCIRGDTGANDTLGGIQWDWVPPTDPTPIGDNPGLGGDGTQPGWTARHVGLAGDHVKTVHGSDVTHMCTMNSPKTLTALLSLLQA